MSAMRRWGEAKRCYAARYAQMVHLCCCAFSGQLFVTLNELIVSNESVRSA
jgi:hypothetical protein